MDGELRRIECLKLAAQMRGERESMLDTIRRADDIERMVIAEGGIALRRAEIDENTKQHQLRMVAMVDRKIAAGDEVSPEYVRQAEIWREMHASH